MIGVTADIHVETAGNRNAVEIVDVGGPCLRPHLGDTLDSADRRPVRRRHFGDRSGRGWWGRRSLGRWWVSRISFLCRLFGLVDLALEVAQLLLQRVDLRFQSLELVARHWRV